ncbi:MAG: MFS transporter [Clostridia bacterium]|nr:MFS transporter [Clostridia bacterium]
MATVNTDAREAVTEQTAAALLNRRFVGKKETAAYVLHDASLSLNINDFKERYIYDVVKIDFNLLAIQDFVATIWDTINDTFIGVVVEKTRTRWGKFKPYLMLGEIPLSVLGMWYWLIPFLFPNTPGDYLPKWIFYFAMSVLTETATTFTAVSKTGFLATITPEPIDRSRLIALANVVTHIFEDIPKQAFGIFYDLVANKKMNVKMANLFSTFGIACTVISAAMAFYFFMTTKERVSQSLKKPTVKHSLKAIINNKPMLIYLLSQFLSGFSISKSRTNFYIDVLGSVTWKTIVGIPAFPVKFISYSFVNPLRKRFSTKALWIFEDAWTDMLWMLVFGIGSINKNFMKKPIILPLMGLEEIFEMCVYGLRRVIPAEIQNEALDYCEWKNGYRAEAMTGVTMSIIQKLQTAVMSSVNNIVMGKIGYIQGKDIGTQTDKTKWWIFALGTGIPIITSSLGIVPKFFYPLSASTRAQMYKDLAERRNKKNQIMQSASAEEIEKLAEAELNGDLT